MPPQRFERRHGKARGGGEDDVAGEPGGGARVVEDLRDLLAHLCGDRAMAAQHEIEALLADEPVELHGAEPAQIDLENEARALVGGSTAWLPPSQIEADRLHDAAIEQWQHENAPIAARRL